MLVLRFTALDPEASVETEVRVSDPAILRVMDCHTRGTHDVLSFNISTSSNSWGAR
jgi:hypothetical protein